VFRNPISFEELQERLPELEERFPGRELDIAEAEEFPIIENVAADSVLQGIEAHGDFGLTSKLFAEFTLDYVHGALKDTDDPLPRILPLRTNVGLRYQYNAFQFGGSVTAVTKQDRVFGEETPTVAFRPEVQLVTFHVVPIGARFVAGFSTGLGL
jgi:hypothetical protein